MDRPQRTATIDRKTKETHIALTLNLDGDGKSDINTGVAFFDHMLDLFTYHGRFNLTLKVKGDIEIDYHHTVEDVGICLGQALRTAMGDGAGIRRYASGYLPMDEALCRAAIDISNRPHLDFNCTLPKTKVGTFDVELAEEFFKAFVNNARLTLHVDVIRGTNLHHIIEACFKALGFHLREALYRGDSQDIPSTKGML